jgi:hypothetical protein
VAKKVVSLAEIIRMLDACAAGYRIEEKLHHYWVTYNGKTFRTLPKGSHANRGHRATEAEIEFGYVRSMIRDLEIDCPCARKFFPDLKCAEVVAG